jgi:integrase
MGYLSPDTMRLLEEVRVYFKKQPGDLIFNGWTNKQIKENFNKIFRKTLQLPITTHDFRTTKLTQLLHENKVAIRVA